MFLNVCQVVKREGLCNQNTDIKTTIKKEHHKQKDMDTDKLYRKSRTDKRTYIHTEKPQRESSANIETDNHTDLPQMKRSADRKTANNGCVQRLCVTAAKKCCMQHVHLCVVRRTLQSQLPDRRTSCRVSAPLLLKMLHDIRAYLCVVRRTF